MALFVLVHGSWHGPWVWEPVALDLRKRGHEVVVPELPIDEAGATWQEYADRVAGAVGDRAQETILVGHSAGAIPVAIAASDNAPRLAVYLTPNPARELPEDVPFGSSPSSTSSSSTTIRDVTTSRSRTRCPSSTLVLTAARRDGPHLGLGRRRKPARFRLSGRLLFPRRSSMRATMRSSRQRA